MKGSEYVKRLKDALVKVELVSASLGDVVSLGRFAKGVDPIRYCGDLKSDLDEALDVLGRPLQDALTKSGETKDE